MKRYGIVIAALLLNACSEKSEPVSQNVAAVSEASSYGGGYNFYRSLPESDFEPFRKVLLAWAKEHHYEVEEGHELQVSKEYAPKCVAKVWVEGDAKGIFKLKHSRNFEGDQVLVDQSTESNNREQESLFEALKPYYVPPQ